MELGRIRKRKLCNPNGDLEKVTIVNGEGNEATQSSYGFVSFFGEAVRRMKANDASASITREVRKELGTEFKNLPPDEKSKYITQSHRAEKVVEERKFLTRCAPDRFAAVVVQLTDDQREVVSEMGLDNLIKLNCGRLKRKLCCWLVQRTDVARCVIEFNGRELELSANSFGYIMGVSDGGMPLQLEGDRLDVAAYLGKYNATSSGINVKTLADILQNSREANDEFKVTFMLFTLCTILCPPIGVHISSSFLYSLKDTQFISKRNWASFCYDKLIQGITRYKEDHLAYVGGCVLYLEMLFCNSIVYGGLRRDRSISPIALWNGYEIKRLIKWIEKKGGYGSIKVSVPLNAGSAKTSGKGSCIHGEHDCTNNSSLSQFPETVNYPLLNLIRQYRAGPFVVARSLEHIDVKIIKYIMNEDLDEGETIVKAERHCLNRNCMLSLAPTRLINVEIISVVAEMLSTLQKYSDTAKCYSWFLPVLNAAVSEKGVLQRWVEENVAKWCEIIDLHTCERIIVPVNHGFAHWYLLVVSVQEHCAEIWDPISSSLTSNLFVTEVQEILNCLDMVLNEDIQKIFGHSFAFRTFSIFQPYSLVKDCQAHDCAVYIAMLMRRIGRPTQPVTEIWSSSDEERLRLMLLLVHFENNVVKKKVVERANIYYIETEIDGVKRYNSLEKKLRTNRMRSRKMGHGPRK